MTYYASVTDNTYSTPGGHFLIHYSTKGQDASTAEYAQQIGTYLEQSWTQEITNLGYNAPTLGGDGRMDVYISDLGTGLYGYASPTDGADEARLTFNKDFSWAPANDDPEGTAKGAMKVTTAHEFFHQVQFGYLSEMSRDGESWWLESSATFMEDEVFNNVNDYRNYLDTFFANTQNSLDSIGGGYETVLINKLLKEKHNGGNPSIIREVLSNIGIFTSAEEAMGKALDSRSASLAEGMANFALWNFLTGTRHQANYYAEGASYPTFSNFQATYSLSNASSSTGEQSVNVSNLAAGYFRATPDSSLTAARSLAIKVSRSHGSVHGWVVVRRTNGTTDVRSLSFNSENKATERISDFSASGINEVVLILSNGEENWTRSARYSFSLEQGLDLIFVIDTTGSMWDDIASVKTAAVDVVNGIASERADFRVALVAYRDFPSYPYGAPGDYPYRPVLPFTSATASITAAIQSLSAFGGADTRESVYSALIRAINTEGLGSWRNGVKKALILMGDAPPHDPEPFTGYTSNSVVAAAEAVDPAIIYSILVGGDPTTGSYFSELASRTKGAMFTAPTAGDVVKAVMEAIGGAVGPGGNNPPVCSAARASVSVLWPPNGAMIPVQILGVTDPDGDAVDIVVGAITQDEPVNGLGDGDLSPDASGVGGRLPLVRAERSGLGDGRVYRIAFVANDGKGGQCSGTVLVGVPRDQGKNTVVVDSGQSYDSTAR